MEEAPATQTDLFSLLPGVNGGRALVAAHGREHMQAIGRRGGSATRDRYGIAYLRELGRIGRQVRRDRAKHQIRLVRFPDGERQRIIPYFPASRRRKRPIRVRFTLETCEVQPC